MARMLDWSRLKTYQNSKYKSFEELCYQLAKRLYSSDGRFTSIDDSRGGDGVEFYLTLSNGVEVVVFIAAHLSQRSR